MTDLFQQFITWVSDGQPSWTINAAGLGPDPSVQISARPVSQEPMVLAVITLCDIPAQWYPLQYIIVNLGMSKNFGSIDFEHLTFPNRMKVDYIRVYQDLNHVNIGCDPTDFPTAAYINRWKPPFPAWLNCLTDWQIFLPTAAIFPHTQTQIWQPGEEIMGNLSQRIPCWSLVRIFPETVALTLDGSSASALYGVLWLGQEALRTRW